MPERAEQDEEESMAKRVKRLKKTKKLSSTKTLLVPLGKHYKPVVHPANGKQGHPGCW
jgi:hypothetical protein